MSGQYISLFIMILLMQPCLVDAKRLRIPKQYIVSQLNREIHTAIIDSCVPLHHQHQLKYYNKLYSSSATDNFSGNIMYYALRTVKAHNNRTKPTVTAEDNATIANITDHSRFIPAGMELANKVICVKLLQEIYAETSLISKTVQYVWDYVCDHRAEQFTNYLFKTRCKTAACNGICGPHTRHNMYQLHGIHVIVLEMGDYCEGLKGSRTFTTSLHMDE